MLAQTLTAVAEHGEAIEKLMSIAALMSTVLAIWKHIDMKKKDRMLNAVIIGTKAALASLNTEDTEIVKASIEKAAGGKEAPLNVALKEQVKKTTQALKAFVPSLLLVLCISGCAGHRAELHETALAHQQLLKALRETSKPVVGVGTIKWNSGWDEAERGAALIEEGTR